MMKINNMRIIRNSQASQQYFGSISSTCSLRNAFTTAHGQLGSSDQIFMHHCTIVPCREQGMLEATLQEDVGRRSSKHPDVERHALKLPTNCGVSAVAQGRIGGVARRIERSRGVDVSAALEHLSTNAVRALQDTQLAGEASGHFRQWCKNTPELHNG